MPAHEGQGDNEEREDGEVEDDRCKKDEEDYQECDHLRGLDERNEEQHGNEDRSQCH